MFFFFAPWWPFYIILVRHLFWNCGNPAMARPGENTVFVYFNLKLCPVWLWSRVWQRILCDISTVKCANISLSKLLIKLHSFICFCKLFFLKFHPSSCFLYVSLSWECKQEFKNYNISPPCSNEHIDNYARLTHIEKEKNPVMFINKTYFKKQIDKLNRLGL